jgi:hypothetical protein
MLRFGTDEPFCEDCGQDNIDMLCDVKRSGQPFKSIICNNCKERTKTPSAASQKRKAVRFQEVGYFEPACVVCHEPDLQVLELDHAFNKANSGVTEPLCANHHAVKSFSAEIEPMASLRLLDPNRRALVLQAAFQLGGSAILGMIAVWDGQQGQASRAIFLGVLATGMLLWALWDIQADQHLAAAYGDDYDHTLPPAPTIPLASATRGTP